MSDEVQPRNESLELAPPPPPVKKPYAAPRVRRLGSVRDLTLGSAGGAFDGGINTKKP